MSAMVRLPLEPILARLPLRLRVSWRDRLPSSCQSIVWFSLGWLTDYNRALLKVCEWGKPARPLSATTGGNLPFVQPRVIGSYAPSFPPFKRVPLITESRRFLSAALSGRSGLTR
jgi:hypothetical protein